MLGVDRSLQGAFKELRPKQGDPECLSGDLEELEGHSKGPSSYTRIGSGTQQSTYGLPLAICRPWQCGTVQVRCVAVSQAGTLMVSASNDLSVKVWDLTQDCRMLLELLGHESAVLTVDLNSDCVVSGDKDEVILWSLADGSILKRKVGFAGDLSVVHFLRDAHVAVAAASDVELILSSSSLRSAKPACKHEARVAALHSSAVPGGSSGEILLACGCDDKHTVLWRLSPQEAKRKKPAAPPELGVQLAARFAVGDQDVRAVSLSRAGNLLACGNDDGILRVWTISPTKAGLSCDLLCSAPDIHTDWIHSVSMAHDGSFVACGSDDNSISLFDVSKQRLVGQVRIFSGAFSVMLAPDLKSLYSASGDIRVWSVPKMVQTHHLTAGPGKHTYAVTGLAVSVDGCQAVSVSSDVKDGKTNGGLQIGLWDCATGSQTAFFKLAGSVEDDDRPMCASMSPDVSRVAVGCDTGKLWIVSLTEPFDAAWVEPEAHSERIYCCEWLEEDTLATGSEDGSVCCWSLKEKVCTATARPYDAGVRCFAWTKDRQRVMCGCDYHAPRLMWLGDKGSDGTILAEFKDVVRQELTVITPCSISISSDDRRAVTTSWDKASQGWR